jgi:soluble lytic murein transglycosylase-like protein
MRRAAPAILALLLTAALPAAARADRQMDPELRGVLAEVLEPTQCFEDRYEQAVWFAAMEPRLSRYVKDAQEREQILHHVHCEARRVDVPPELVLAVMDVESRFDRYAVSSAGAVGLMQVMPFWPRELGMSNEQLIRIADNVRMGTTILGYYLRKERGNYQRALQRYNGSLGRPTYSDLVIDRLVARWRVDP